jgi:hypothetical protein
VGVFDRHIQLGVLEGVVKGVNTAVKAVLEESPTLQGEVLWSAEWGATRAEWGFRGVRGAEVCRIRPSEGMVDCQLKSRGSNMPGVLGAAGLATKLVPFHLNGGLPEWVVATGRGVGNGVGKSCPVQWETSHA